MAGQLRAVLERFTEQSAPVSLNRMAKELNLEPGVLHGMIDYWVRKGRLREVSGTSQNCSTCGIKSACPFVIAMPRYYEVVQEGESSDDAPACGCNGTCTM